MPVNDPASPLSVPINDLFLIVLILGGVVLLGVTAALVIFARRYRAAPDAPDPAPSFGNRRLEIAWVSIPLLLVLVLFGLSLRVAFAVEPSTAGRTPDIIVRGHQWWWEVIYPDAGVVTANEIHIPAGKQLLVRLESADVIHSFWVPELGRKKDMIPGQPNTLWLEAAHPGVYTGACSEFCGAEHAWMRLRVVADSPADFAAWERRMAAPAAAPTSDLARQGQQIFASHSCASCHAVEAGAQSPNVGPSLAHLSERATLAAGAGENTPAGLAAWLKNPEQIKPQSLMPNLNLTPDEVKALVAYLEAKP